MVILTNNLLVKIIYIDLILFVEILKININFKYINY